MATFDQHLEDLARLGPAFRDAGGALTVGAAEVTARDATTRLAAAPVPNVPGSVFYRRSRTHADAAEVGLAYSRFPWLAGAEMGSRKYRQFRTYRGKFGARGYVLKPALDATSRGQRTAAADAGLKVARRMLRR